MIRRKTPKMSQNPQPPPEIRHVSLYQQPHELRADEAGKIIAGYAATFNAISVDLGGFREIIAPSAFADSIRSGKDIRALVDHDYAKLLGRTSAKTLRLKEDKTGLADEIDLPDTTYARDLLASVRRKDIGGQSFGFRVLDDDWTYGDDDVLVRTLLKVDLSEVTVTSIPAYPNTSISERRSLVIPDEVRSRIQQCRRYPRRGRAARKLQISSLA